MKRNCHLFAFFDTTMAASIGFVKNAKQSLYAGYNTDLSPILVDNLTERHFIQFFLCKVSINLFVSYPTSSLGEQTYALCIAKRMLGSSVEGDTASKFYENFAQKVTYHFQLCWQHHNVKTVGKQSFVRTRTHQANYALT